MFNLNDLNRKFGDIHPGLDLVTTIPVGIPLHSYDVDLTLYEPKSYPLLNEHVLRCLVLGLNHVKSISDFLGIPESFIADAIVQEEAGQGTIATTRQGNLRITDHGKLKLEDLLVNEARRSTQQLHVDLISNQVTYFSQIVSNVDKLNQELGEFSEDEYVRRLEGTHSTQKVTSDFTVEEVNALLPSKGSRKIHVLEVLTSRRVSKKPFYALGQVLVFSDPLAKNIKLNMIIGGERSTVHDKVLAEKSVFEALQIIIDPAAEEPTPRKIFTEKLTSQTPKIQEIVQKIEEMPILLENEEVSIEELPSGPSPALIAKRQSIGPYIFRPQQKTVRLAVWDHPALRNEAVKFAKERLLIISPWVKKSVVNSQFLRDLERAIDRGVTIDIGMGIGDDFKDSHIDAINLLVDLSRANPEKLRLHKWRSHEKILIADQTFINTSFNWLSFKGASDNHYRRESGMMTVDKETADEFYIELLNAMKIERQQGWPFNY
jgi:hypothetical protein